MAWYGLNRKRIVVLPHLITICNSLNSHENFCARYYMQHIYYIVSFERSDFYKICQQQKQVKTMDLEEVWPDTFDKGYIYRWIPTWTHSQNSVATAEAPRLKIYS